MTLAGHALRKMIPQGPERIGGVGGLRGMVKLVFGLALWILTVIPVQAATQQEIDTSWDQGLAWLLQHQSPDGSWGSVEGAKMVATSEAMNAFNKAGVKNYAYAAGLAWLAAAKSDNIDSLARKIVALHQAGFQTEELENQLLEWKNKDSTWGTYTQFDVSFPDTALASKAFRVSASNPGLAQFNIQEGLKAMLEYQLTTAPDTGSWTYYPRYPLSVTQLVNGRGSSLVATSYNLIELEAGITELGLSTLGGNSLPDGRDAGVNWLLTLQQSDGGFSETSNSSILETALAYNALSKVPLPNFYTGLTNALDFLIAQQEPIAYGWSSDALQTAVVLAAFPPPSTVPLVDTDGDGIPDGVETILGTDPLTPDSRDILLKGPTGQGAQSQGSGGEGESGGGNPPPITPDGDVNEDGLVTVADLALLEQIVLGLVTPTADQISHGDVAPDGIPDGVLNVADVERLGRMIVEGL